MTSSQAGREWDRKSGPSPIYLDHHATTPLDPRVLDAMLPYLREDFGNAASTSHVFGWRAEAAVEEARERIAAAISARPAEVIFTSGATESNNLALFGALANASAGHLVSVETEHVAVLDPCRQLERSGRALTLLPVSRAGLVDVNAIAGALREETRLVSVMAANNEIGVLQPVAAIGALCHEAGVLFHCDAAQAAGRIPLDVQASRIDLLSLSAHKFYGPKGVGALYVRGRAPRVRLEARQFGGGHEGGLRSGTLPVAQIVGMAKALELSLDQREVEEARLRDLRDLLWQRLEAELGGVHLNGDAELRLAGNLNVAFEGVDGARLLLALPRLAVSLGSACASSRPGPSPVLTALGLPAEWAGASLRFGLGRETSREEIEQAASWVIEAVRRERAS
ncbi:MAG: cysteine desulfurase family protein [Myxococcota bacterium]|nr:cysteine desulfurase family protein [Myxococcota bacterium]